MASFPRKYILNLKESTAMHIPVRPRILFIALACVIAACLIILTGLKVNAQSPHGTFNELLRPYVNKEITVSGPPGRFYDSMILREVGFDYVLIESPTGLTQAIPLTSIYTLTFGGDRPQIHMNGF
jgi:hypothetical protein